MQRVFIYLFFVGFAGWIVFFYGINQVNAFSISPSPLRIENIHPLYPVVKQITVGRRDATRAADIEIEKQGKDADSIKLSAEKFTIQAGENDFPYEITLDAKGIEPGEKEARVVFLGTELGGTGAGSALNISLVNKISWTVTTTILREVEISDFTSEKLDDRFGGWRRKLSFYFRNNGNATEDIVEIKYLFFDDDGLVKEKVVDFKKIVSPFSYTQIDLLFDRWRLKRGQNYKVQILVKMADGREIVEDQNLILLPDKSFSQKRSALSGGVLSRLYESVVLCVEEVFNKLLDLFG